MIKEPSYLNLLVKRDPVFLLQTAGTSEFHSSLPKIVRTPFVVAPEQVKISYERNALDDVLLVDERDHSSFAAETKPVPSESFTPVLPARWSGTRSVITEVDGTMYRFKGVACDPENPKKRNSKDDFYDIYGGQFRKHGYDEKAKLAVWNKALAEEGIRPVYEWKGFWHYQTPKNSDKLSASIFKVQGDTRLDEFMHYIELNFGRRIHINRRSKSATLTKEGLQLAKKIATLYHDIGFVVGQQKQYTDRRGMTWGTGNKYFTNAHIGNIIVYQDPKKKDILRVGLVDFDDRHSKKNLLKSAHDRIRGIEFYGLGDAGTCDGRPLSPRPIHAPLLADWDSVPSLRRNFQFGLLDGYCVSLKRHKVSDAVDFSTFSEIASLLRSPGTYAEKKRKASEINKDGDLLRRTVNFYPHPIFRRGRKNPEEVPFSIAVKNFVALKAAPPSPTKAQISYAISTAVHTWTTLDDTE